MMAQKKAFLFPDAATESSVADKASSPFVVSGLRVSSAMEHPPSWLERSDQEVEPGVRVA
jgi:hypothetical protein